MDNLGRQGEDFNNNLNKTLHTMTAHLHRYGSELGRFADIVEHVKQQYEDFYSNTRRDEATASGPLSKQRTISAITQIKSQLQDVDTFRQELGHKTQNILALVCRQQSISLLGDSANLRQLFNNIQVSNDKVMVANGKAMNKMLKASRAEAQMAMRLAEEMKKDSVAMKTV
jgi:hypothetical protein